MPHRISIAAGVCLRRGADRLDDCDCVGDHGDGLQSFGTRQGGRPIADVTMENGSFAIYRKLDICPRSTG